MKYPPNIHEGISNNANDYYRPIFRFSSKFVTQHLVGIPIKLSPNKAEVFFNIENNNMKLCCRILAVIATLVFFQSHSSFADETSAQKHIASFLHGSSALKKHVAHILLDEKSDDFTVLDVVAETMLRDYQTTDDLVADYVGWGLMALSASRKSRYRNILREMEKTAQHKKVSSYAGRALKRLYKRRIDQYVKGSVSLEELKPQYKPVENTLFSSANIQTQDAPNIRNYISSLAHGDAALVTYTAKALYNNPESDTLLLDVLAEIILRDHQSPNNQIIHSIAWACKALGASQKSRYRSILQDVKKQASSKQIAKHAKKALKRLAKSDDQQYTKGQVILAKIKHEYAASEKIITPESRYWGPIAKPKLVTPDYSTLVIYRPELIPPFTHKPMISINGREAFYLKRGCRMDVKLLPGEYRVETNWGKWHNLHSQTGVSVQLNAGETVFVRNGTSINSDTSKLKRCNGWSPSWLVQNPSIPQAAQSAQKNFNEHEIAKDIHGGNAKMKSTVANFIVRNGAYTDLILEALKDEISLHYKDPFTNKLNRKAILHLSKALAKSERLEYQDFLIRVGNDAHNRKFRAHVKSYVAAYMNL